MSDSNERKKKQKKNPLTYTQIHTPTVVKPGGWRGRLEPLPGVFDIFFIKTSFDLLNKMRYIL